MPQVCITDGKLQVDWMFQWTVE